MDEYIADRQAQKDQHSRDRDAARSSYEDSITNLTGALQRAKEEARLAASRAEHETAQLRREHEAEKEDIRDRQSEQVHETLELGKQLGRDMERYGDDWEHLSPVQRAERKQAAQRREAQHRALQKMVADLQSRASVDHDEQAATLKEQFEIGRRQGYDEAWKEVELEGDADGEQVVPKKPAVALRSPRWRIYRSSLDDPTDDEWTIHNPVTGSGITSLRLEVDRRLFSVYDAADWPEVEPDQEYFTFHGGATKLGGKDGYAFTLVWEVGDGWPRSEDVPPEEPPLYAGF